MSKFEELLIDVLGLGIEPLKNWWSFEELLIDVSGLGIEPFKNWRSFEGFEDELLIQ